MNTECNAPSKERLPLLAIPEGNLLFSLDRKVTARD